ncbi:MAG: TonB-dependent receptor [Lysobacteraceae bacterium]|nr:MAG: TonB-dependent receptor [Xanthomonadaceae bacterium]
MATHLFSRTPLFLALSLVVPSLVCAQQPSSESTDHGEAHEIDRIVVTASPLRQSADDLSQPVEVLSGEALDEAMSTTLGETLTKLPGVQSSNFGAGVGRPVIRGLDGARVGVLSGGLSNQDVSTISQDHATAIEPFLADQIEVLKGPATLLYGSGAIGGVVNVVDGRIAERPLDAAVRGRAEIRYGSVDDGRNAMLRIDASGADGAMALHADGVFRDQDDYDTPDGVQANSFVETRTGALGASLVGERGFVGVALSRYDHRYGNPGEPGDPDAGEAGVSLDMLQHRVELKAGLRQDFAIFDGLRIGYAHTDYEHTEFEGADIGTRFLSTADEGRLELTHRNFDAWSGAVGLQIGDRSFEAIGAEAFVPRTSTRGQGLFWIEQGRWGNVQIDLGARADRVRIDAVGMPKRDFSPLSLSAGVSWRVGDAWRLTANIDRAERAPAEEELFADGPHVATASYEIGDPTMREERANQVELGLHFNNGRFDVNASIYQNRFDGFVYLADTGEFTEPEPGEDPLPIRRWTQADAKFRGIEAEVIAHLHDGDGGNFDLRVFGDRVRAELDGGGNLPRIAPGRFGADLRWQADTWRASIGATRVMRQSDVAPDETSTDGYTLLDAHFAYRWSRDSFDWEVFVDGNNLGDAKARVHTSYLKDTVVLPGRNLALGVRLFF